MKKVFEIKELGKQVTFNNSRETFVIGNNGSGKTFFLKELKKECQKQGYNYGEYDAMTIFDRESEILDSLFHIRIAFKILSKEIRDFKDAAESWSRSIYIKRIDELVTIEAFIEIYTMMGTGFQRLILMFTDISKTGAGYYFIDNMEA